MAKRATPEPEHGPLKLIRLSELCAETGLSRWTVMRRVRAGKFPRPVMTGSIVAWRRETIDQRMKAKEWA
jgi:predicted DNA-binding transcriptional regulator AlpA